MPCHDSRDDVRPSGVDPLLKLEVERLAKRCAELTDLLCRAGRATYRKTEAPADVLKWWDEHRKLDQRHGQPW